MIQTYTSDVFQPWKHPVENGDFVVATEPFFLVRFHWSNLSDQQKHPFNVVWGVVAHNYFFWFTFNFSEMIQFDEHIFQRGGSTTNYS